MFSKFAFLVLNNPYLLPNPGGMLSVEQVELVRVNFVNFYIIRGSIGNYLVM